MKILLTGAAGQLGSELLTLLPAHGRVIATDRNTPAEKIPGWQTLDISDGASLETLLNSLQPALIVNSAAYTAVDQAETDRQTAFDINAELPARLASWAKRNDARLIHYSTDYVFDGQAVMPYLESDLPAPLNTYGESKLAGERAIAATGCEHVTLRTSWVYSSHGKNFVLSMLNLAQKGVPLKIVNDQQGCPTWARNLALASHAVIDRWLVPGAEHGSGVFHYCDDRSLNWYDFSREIFSAAVNAGLLNREPEVVAIKSSGFPQPAKRPKWSVLNTARIGKVFKIHPASFKQALQAVLSEVSTRGLT
jgi:dTDP-4-dehydrorhamnose reductase